MSEEKRTRRVTGNDSIDGLLLLLLGLILVIWPQSAMHVVVMILGGAIALFGVARCVVFFQPGMTGRQGKDLLGAVIMVVLGIAMLVKSGFFVGILYLIIGAVVALGCVLMGLKVLRLRGGDKLQQILATVFGVALLILAVLIFVNPSSLGSFLFRLQGIALLVEGVSMILVKPRT